MCPELAAWFDAWSRDSVPIAPVAFEPTETSLYAAARMRYQLDYREYLVGSGIPWELQAEILTFSPDSTYAVDEWLFAVGSDSLGLLSARGPDMRVGLVDLRTGTATVVLSGGTALAVYVTCWLSPTAFVIGGTVQDASATGFHPMVWQYDVASDSVVTFRGPLLSSATPREAVNSWLAGRFPSIRR